MDGDPATYERLLRDAYDLGVLDGRAAAARGLYDADAESDACRGLGPEQLAVELWQRRPGRPPSGLPLNGARWYAAGYRAGLAQHASGGHAPGPRSAKLRRARQPAGFEGL
jgi:hypothetical protein